MDNNSEALQFGYGIFETILIRNGELVYFSEHFSRASVALLYLGMKTISKEKLLADTNKYIEENDIVDGVLKICFYLNNGCTEIVFYNRKNPYTDKDYMNGFKLCLSEIKRHSENPIYSIKSTNFINNTIEMKNIRKIGFNESIHINESGFITECIYSNIFFIKDDEIYTPKVDSGLLAGIMRQKVIDISKKIGISTKVGYYSIEDLKNADEIFLTSSIIGIMRVSSFEDKKFDKLSNSLIDMLLKEM